MSPRAPFLCPFSLRHCVRVCCIRSVPLRLLFVSKIAGRAGRRGLDTCGNVYIFSAGEQLPNHSELAAMMLHKATPLQSRFRLTFAMLLQLVVRQGFKPVDMISRSFKETIRAQQLPLLKRDLVRRQKVRRHNYLLPSCASSYTICQCEFVYVRLCASDSVILV